jgi:hypothetical protein
MMASRSPFVRWMQRAFTTTELRAIAEKGAGVGARKLSNTAACARLFDRHAHELWQLVLAASARRPGTRLMKQWIVWFAAEEAARRVPVRAGGRHGRVQPRSKRAARRPSPARPPELSAGSRAR